MKTNKTSLGSAAFAIPVLFLVAASPPPAEPSPPAAAESAFAFDLYGKLSGGDGNLFFSPFSISSALSLAHAGARGETADEIGRALHLAPLGADVPGAARSLRRSLEAAGGAEGIMLRTANGLWADREVTIRDEYRKIARESYDAETGTLDFAKDPEKARHAINEWVNGKTDGGVPELLAPGSVKRETRLVLADAIRFLGRWHRPFEKETTRERPFTTLGGAVTTMSAMSGKAEFPYYEDDRVQVLEMPYVGERLSMVAVLPRKADGLREVEKDLSAEAVDRWIAGLAPCEVMVRFPKFSFGSAFDLESALAALGMTTAFTGAADFSGITGERDLYVSGVYHGAAIEVSEEGTDASAATAVVMQKLGLVRTPNFHADHPFLFFIRDRETGSILFVGRLADPAATAA